MLNSSEKCLDVRLVVFVLKCVCYVCEKDRAQIKLKSERFISRKNPYIKNTLIPVSIYSLSDLFKSLYVVHDTTVECKI